jgi:hypothetical protein
VVAVNELPVSVSSRRDFLRRAGGGCGLLALAAMLQDGREDPALRTTDLARDGNAHARAGQSGARPPHFPAKAKSVIWLYMEGGPSAIDLFDPKPELEKRKGQEMPGVDTHFGNPGPLMPSPYRFLRAGQTGRPVCERYATLARCIDDVALIKSCWVESANHATANYQMNTGLPRPNNPSVGAWVTYGLGSENSNLPGFMVFAPGIGKGGPQNWGSGYLPAHYQGTLIRTDGPTFLDLDRPRELGDAGQRAMLDLAGRLNGLHAARHPGESELEARIASFELAYRMQAEAPEVTDLSGETEETLKLYGVGERLSERFGRKCLMARRLVERGVRFVQIYPELDWDAHFDLRKNHDARCAETDAPIAGLLTDLKRRGLLDSTLVIWGGEFGRLPLSQANIGRDHNPYGFLMWMAGGGVKPGVSYGETDDIGFKAVVDPVSVHDIHATVLHLLGLDHKRLTYFRNGRQFRLTDVSGEVITKILA